MVVLNRIYTRTGDAGTTALSTGERRSKADLRVDAYGAVDEANAVIGLARLHAADAPELDAILNRIQNDLFDLGADLATPETDKDLGYEPLRIIPSQVDRLEQEIDGLNARLQPLRSFVLPAGTPLATHLHFARTVVRRAERQMVAAAAHENLTPAAIRYMNRLSDLLFVMARVANADGTADVLWKPGATRG